MNSYIQCFCEKQKSHHLEPRKYVHFSNHSIIKRKKNHPSVAPHLHVPNKSHVVEENFVFHVIFFFERSSKSWVLYCIIGK